jgi:hypothetical protein
MSKPIFIIRYPENAKESDLMIATESLNRMGFYNDYHTLIIKDQFTGGEIKFECFNAPHTEIEFEELKERILTLLKHNQKE